MGLQACRECGHPVSTEAPICPHCGAPRPTELGSTQPAALEEPLPAERPPQLGRVQQAVLGVLAWVFGVLAALAGIVLALTDPLAGLLILLIAALLLPPVTRVLRQKLNLALPVKAKAYVIIGLLIAVAIASLSHDAAQQRDRDRAAHHKIRLRAESILASVSTTMIPQLPDSTLGLLSQWTDSTADTSRRRAVFTEGQAREARRRARVEQQRRVLAEHVEQQRRVLAEQQRRTRATQQQVAQQRRAERVRVAVEAFHFSDGSRCKSDGQERAAGYVEDGVGWSDNDLVRVACHAIWVGMTAAQLMASWGSPRTNNRSVFAEGERDQWVYGDFGPYVYLDNGIVTSYQTTRR